ncbi:DedA family protein [Archangium violaceum]|uniref:DedA family protein n=1 Tax=Archangium violaceum TaxID=83451 RepID=UPI00193B48AD|nr:DedA family protein [Archangium violaceum]QRK06397.1 DedA family protein [Archangium violaceum]
MQEFLTNLLGSTHGFLAYATVFGILVACGLGVPLPEDISLILGGFLAHKGAASLPMMMLIGFGGILVGDSLIFLAGRRLGTQVGRSPTGFLARVVTPEKRARVEGLFALHGQKIVMIARFLPGVRAVTYFTAGSAGMSYWRFIFWDGLAALLSAPFFVWLGFHFGDKLDYAIDRMKEGQLVVVGVLAVVGLVAFVWRKRIAALRSAALKAAVKASPVPAHLLAGAPEAQSAAAPVFEKPSSTERLQVRD